jgi:hypothetical protein
MILLRTLFLGALAGLSMAGSYLIFVAIHASAAATERSIYLGGRILDFNGRPQTELPGVLALFAFLAMPLFGILLSRIDTGAQRPNAWLVALAGWFSISGAIIWGVLTSGTPMVYFAPVPAWVLFGFLFGAAFRSRFAISCLMVGAPLSWLAGTLISHSEWFGFITDRVAPYGPGHLSFALSTEALREAASNLLHGLFLSVVVYFATIRRASTSQGEEFHGG